MAALNVVARKKTQPSITSARVPTVATMSYARCSRAAFHAVDFFVAPVNSLWSARRMPWYAPQITNVIRAPCHRPPSVIVRNRLRYVAS